MINLEKFNHVLNGYKAYFPTHWSDEKYKWEAIKHFQDNWDIDAENFGDMFNAFSASHRSDLRSKSSAMRSERPLL